MEIYREYVQISYVPIKFRDLVILAVEDLYYNHEVLGDEQWHRFSLDRSMQHTD